MGPPPPDDDERGTEVEIARRRNARLYWDHRHYLHFGIRKLPKHFKRQSYDGMQWIDSTLKDVKEFGEFEDVREAAQNNFNPISHASRVLMFKKTQEAWQEFYEELKQYQTEYGKYPEFLRS